MSARREITVFRILLVLAAAALPACSSMESALKRSSPETAAGAPAPETTASTSSPQAPAVLPTTAEPASPPAGPMTREQASTDCWMKYERSGLSLDQRLPLVEKCTAEKLKAAAR